MALHLRGHAHACVANIKLGQNGAMLKSLFGELSTDTATPQDDSQGMQASRVLEFRRHVADEDGRVTEQLEQNLFVSGSPAFAMRSHLAKAYPSEGHQVITLLDPAARLAPKLIRALCAATDQPVQRLNIRDQASQRVMATLERTVIPRRGDGMLKLYHATVPTWLSERWSDDDSESTPYVLMEASNMAAVIIDDAEPAWLDDMLAKLALASQSSTWRCPTLVFVVTPQTAWAAERVRAIDWPDDIQVQTIQNALVSPALVWNALLGAWDQNDLASLPNHAVEQVRSLEMSRAIGRELRKLMATAGIASCAVGDLATGALVAGESRDASINLSLSCDALAPLMRAQIEASQQLGGTVPLEECFLSAGELQYVVRPLLRNPPRFLFARLNRSQSNLTLVRLKVAEAHQALN